MDNKREFPQPQELRDKTKLELLLDELRGINTVSYDMAAQLVGLNQKIYQEPVVSKGEVDKAPMKDCGLFPDIFECVANIKDNQARQQTEIATLLARI